VGVITAKAMACSVRGVGARGERREHRSKIRWIQAGMGVLEGEHRFEACGDNIAGKGGVEAGIKPSKGGCCPPSSCDRAAAQRIYGVLGGSGHTSRSPKCTDTPLNK
jgi:hypothetical protein